MWMGLLGAAAGMGSGLMSAFAQQYASKKSYKIAVKQMDFQKYMAETAYQRAMADMKKAGLNPILAYQQGGAAVPPGARSEWRNPMAGNRTSALDMMRAVQELRNLRAQEEETRERTNTLSTEASKNMEQAWLHRQNQDTSRAHELYFGTQKGLLDLETSLLATRMPEARTAQEFQESWPGRWSKKWQLFRNQMGIPDPNLQLLLPIGRFGTKGAAAPRSPARPMRRRGDYSY